MIDDEVPGEIGEAETLGTSLFVAAEDLKIARKVNGGVRTEFPMWTSPSARWGVGARQKPVSAPGSVIQEIEHGFQVRNSQPRPLRDCSRTMSPTT